MIRNGVIQNVKKCTAVCLWSTRDIGRISRILRRRPLLPVAGEGPRKSGIYDIIGIPRGTPHVVAMTLPKDAFRRFQEELAALDKQIEQRKPTKKQAALSAMERAREDFLALKEHYKLSVADVIAFFPEEEGIAYLQGLIAQAQAKPRRGRKPKAST